MEKKNKKKINWKRTIKNNGYMLNMISKAVPGYIALALIVTVIGAFRAFLFGTYLYKYALNALQNGEKLKTILITLGVIFAFAIFEMILQNVTNCYFNIKYKRVDEYMQTKLQKKAVELDLECFENSSL